MSELRPLHRIRKTVGCLLVAAVMFAGVNACAAAEATTQPDKLAEPTTKPAKLAEATSQPAKLAEPTTRPAGEPAPVEIGTPFGSGQGDITGLMWQMLASALMVLVIGGVALFVLKKLLPKIRSVSHKKIAVIETAYLGSRRAVHLLQVGSMKLLIASSPEGVVRLGNVTRAFPAEYAEVAQRIEARGDASDSADQSPQAESNT